MRFKNFVCVVLFFILSCAKRGPSGADAQSVYEPAAVWPKKSLGVCWGGSFNSEISDFSSDTKAIIEKSIQSEFSKAGLNFKAFTSCPANDSNGKSDDVDVIIMRGEPNKHFNMAYSVVFDSSGNVTGTGLGHSVRMDVASAQKFRYVAPKPGERLLNIVVFKFEYKCEEGVTILPISDCISRVAVHEFGHVLGLRHEHIRPEAANDPNCKIEHSDSDGREEGFGASANIGNRKYDSESIMNYCYRDAVNEGLVKNYLKGLSPNDVLLLKEMYPQHGMKKKLLRRFLS